MSSQFQETRWTLLQRARDEADPEVKRRALDELCVLYWKPLFWFVRRQGHGPEDSADLVQGFFAVILSRSEFDKADRRKGRLRSFLLAILKGYLSDDRKRAGAQKRGGGAKFDSIDSEEGERMMESMAGTDAGLLETGYDRVWARTVLDRAMGRLEDEMTAKGRDALFGRLKPAILGVEPASFGSLAEEYGMTEGAVRVFLHRLRNRVAELLRAEVADTLQPEESVEAELRYLAELVAE